MQVTLLFLLSIATAELFSANAGPAAVTTTPAKHIPHFFCNRHFDGIPQRHLVPLGNRLLAADRRAVNGPAITQVSDELTDIFERNFDIRSPFNPRWPVTSLSRMQDGDLIIGTTDVTGEYNSILTIVPCCAVEKELRSYQGIEYSEIKVGSSPTCKPATAGDLFAFGDRTGARVYRIDSGTWANDQSIDKSKEGRKKGNFETHLAHLTGTGMDSLSFAAGGNTLLAASFRPEESPSVVKIFDLTQSKTQSTIQNEENLSGKEKATFSPEDPNLLAVVGAAAVKLYDLRNKEKKPVATIQFHTHNTPTSCSWDSQTRLTVTSSLNQVMVINPNTLGYSCFELPEYNHPNATALVSNGGKDFLFVAGTQHLHRIELP